MGLLSNFISFRCSCRICNIYFIKVYFASFSKVGFKIKEKTTNILQIEDGKADMMSADCPDQLCVHQNSISKENQTIVCLPNKIVAEIIGADKAEYDAVVK